MIEKLHKLMHWVFSTIRGDLCVCRAADCISMDDGFAIKCTVCGRVWRLPRKVYMDNSIRRRMANQAARDLGFYAGGYVSDGHNIVRFN